MNAPGYVRIRSRRTGGALGGAGERELAAHVAFEGEDAILVDYKDYH